MRTLHICSLLTVALFLTTTGCGDDDGAVGACGMAVCPEDDAGAGLDAGSPAVDAGETDAAIPMDEVPAVVDAAWVTEHLEDATVQLLDARGAVDFATGHIPGALSIDPGALRATVGGVSGQVADLATVQGAMQAAGLSAGTRIVVYGAATEPTPARVVWTLAYYGHEDVHLLDGGMTDWPGMEETGPSTASAGDWIATGPNDQLRVDVDWVESHLDDPMVVLADARTAAEYGSGHIPGALSVNWQNNVSGASYMAMADVAALYDGISPDSTVVAYCQSGTRASLTFQTLVWLGFEDVRLYDGSWAEWGSRMDLPREP